MIQTERAHDVAARAALQALEASGRRPHPLADDDPTTALLEEARQLAQAAELFPELSRARVEAALLDPPSLPPRAGGIPGPGTFLVNVEPYGVEIGAGAAWDRITRAVLIVAGVALFLGAAASFASWLVTVIR